MLYMSDAIEVPFWHPIWHPAHHVVVDDHDVGDRVAVGVLEIRVATPGQDEAVALLLAQHGREAQRVLAPRHVPYRAGVDK